jgi:hypothetical protein
MTHVIFLGDPRHPRRCSGSSPLMRAVTLSFEEKSLRLWMVRFVSTFALRKPARRVRRSRQSLAPSAWAGVRRHDLPCIARQFKNRVQVRISTFTRLHVEDALMKMSLFKPSLSLYIILSCNSQ